MANVCSCCLLILPLLLLLIGQAAPYHASYSNETIFQVASLMPNNFNPEQDQAHKRGRIYVYLILIHLHSLSLPLCLFSHSIPSFITSRLDIQRLRIDCLDGRGSRALFASLRINVSWFSTVG